MRRFLPFVGLACALVLFPGCTPKIVKVKGRLVRSGQTQTFAEDAYVTLQFIPVDGEDGQRSYSARLTRTEGTYEVELPPGKYRTSLFVPPKDFDISKPEFRGRPPVGGALAGPEFEFKGDTTQDIEVP